MAIRYNPYNWKIKKNNSLEIDQLKKEREKLSLYLYKSILKKESDKTIKEYIDELSQIQKQIELRNIIDHLKDDFKKQEFMEFI